MSDKTELFRDSSKSLAPLIQPHISQEILDWKPDKHWGEAIYCAEPNDTIVLWSDLEGKYPKFFISPNKFISDSVSAELQPIGSEINKITDNLYPLSLQSELEPYFIFDSITGDIIDIKPNIILVYLGDIIGVGPDNIKLANLLFKLKKSKPKKVILLMGNRDINRRMISYLLKLKENSEKKLCEVMRQFIYNGLNTTYLNMGDASASSPTGEKKSHFEHLRREKFNFLWETDSKNWPTLISDEPDIVKRIKLVAEHMGETDTWKLIVDEWLLDFVKLDAITVEQTYTDEHRAIIYLYLINIMSNDNFDRILTTDKNHAIKFNAFHGLFIIQKDNSHLLACIMHKQTGKIAMLSHSLPHRGKIPIEAGKIFYNQKFQNPIDPLIRNDARKMQLIRDKNLTQGGPYGKFKLTKLPLLYGLTQIDKNYHDLFSYLDNDNIIRRIEFASGITSGSYKLYKGQNRYTGINATINTDPTFSPETIKMIINNIQTAGSFDNLEVDSTSFYINPLEECDIWAVGHKPVGHIPVVINFEHPYSTKRVKRLICVDVSKIQKQEYMKPSERRTIDKISSTFATYIIKPDWSEDHIIGRFFLQQSDFNADHTLFVPPFTDHEPLKDGKKLFVNYSQAVIPQVLKSLDDKFQPTLELTYRDGLYKYTYADGPNYKKAPTLIQIGVHLGGISKKYRKSYNKKKLNTRKYSKSTKNTQIRKNNKSRKNTQIVRNKKSRDIYFK
jgi:hypothetical protein